MGLESSRFSFPDRDCHTLEPPECGQEPKCQPKPRKRKSSFPTDYVLSHVSKESLMLMIILSPQSQDRSVQDADFINILIMMIQVEVVVLLLCVASVAF